MASPSILTDRVKHGGGAHTHERREHVTRQNGCHGSDNTITETPPDENSTKNDQMDSASDRCAAAVPKAKGSKKSKRVDGKKMKKRATSDPILTNSQQKSLSQQTEEVLKSMSGLTIYDNFNQRARTSEAERVEAETGSAGSMEAQLNKLSLEDSQQLIERGPQRNRESNPARQSKPYYKSAVSSSQANADQASCPGTGVSEEDADDFIKNLLYAENIAGVSNDVSAQPPPAAVTSNVETTSQTHVNLADQWLDSVNSSPDTGVPNMSPATTTSGQCQFSGPVPNLTFNTHDCIPVTTMYQPPEQVPTMNQTSTVILLPVQGSNGFQYGYTVPSIPLNPNTNAQPVFSDQLPHHIFPSTSVNDVNGVFVPNFYNSLGFQGNTSFHTEGLSAATGDNYPPPVTANPDVWVGLPPALNGTVGHFGVPGHSISGKLVPCGSTVNGQNGFSSDQAHSCVGTQSQVKLEEETEYTGRDPSIPNVVPTQFEPDEDKKPKAPKNRGRNKEKTSPKTVPGTIKKNKKKSPKEPSTPKQSPSALTNVNVSPLCTTTSSQSNSHTPLAVIDQTSQSMSESNGTDAAFKDAMDVMNDNLQEDFMTQKVKKRTTRQSKSGELDQNIIYNLTNNQLTSPTSAVSPQSQNECSNAHSSDSLVRPQPAPPHVPQYQQMTPLTQSVSANQQLDQFSQQIQQNQQTVSSAAFTNKSVDPNLSPHAVSSGQPTQVYQAVHNNQQTTNFAMSPTGHSEIPLGQNTSVLQATPAVQCDQQTTFQEYCQQAACLQSTHQAAYQQEAHQQFGQPIINQQCGQNFAHILQDGQQIANHPVPVYPPQTTGLPPVPQHPAISQPVNPSCISTICQTQVQVSVTHKPQGPSSQTQTKQVVLSPPKGIASSPLGMGGHKIITAGYSGASPMGVSAIDIILKKLPTILPKPV